MLPLVHPHPELNFGSSFTLILGKVFPLLLCPFLAAILLRVLLPKVHAKVAQYHELSFYLWAVALTLAIGVTVKVSSTATCLSGIRPDWESFPWCAVVCSSILERKPGVSMAIPSVPDRLWDRKHRIRHLDGLYFLHSGDGSGCRILQCMAQCGQFLPVVFAAESGRNVRRFEN